MHWNALDVLGGLLKLSLVETGLCFFKAAELKVMLLTPLNLSHPRLSPEQECTPVRFWVRVVPVT